MKVNEYDISHHNLGDYVSENKLMNNQIYLNLLKAVIEFENTFNEILFIHIQNFTKKKQNEL